MTDSVSPSYALRAARVLDPADGRVQQNMYVHINDGLITETTTERPLSVPLLDLGDVTLLPGLIDCHTHMLLRPEDQVFPPAITHKTTPYRAVEGVAAVNSAVQLGFTTVRDTGNEQAWHCDTALRDAIARDVIPGPQMFVATDTLSITGGDMRLDDRVNPQLGLPDLAEMVDSRAEMVKAVRRQIRLGADWIKLYATSTQMDVDPETMEPLHQVDLEDVKTIVAEAKRFRRDVAAHAYGGAAALAASRGGVRTIEHGPLLTDEDLAVMSERGTYWVPTFSTYVKPGEYWGKQSSDFHQRFVTSHKSALPRAQKARVRIAFGTDVGSFPHGEQLYEFRLLVDYGMSPLDALRAATTTAAQLLRREGQIGCLRPGAQADLLAVTGDPISDITAIENAVFVARSGRILRDDAAVAQPHKELTWTPSR